jgi:hypothetical protein
MIPTGGSPLRRAQRLVRCYPRVWRARYGEEFTQLLIDDISERPRSWRRVADVVRTGALARLAQAGLAENDLEPPEQVRAGLAVVGFALAGFLVLGTAIWAQLTIGWQWSAPSARATAAGMLVMSAAIACLIGLALLAVAPIAWALYRAIASRARPDLAGPLALAVAGAAVLGVGGHHFGHGWPGTGGRPWAHSGLVPGSVASFSWASTLWVTSYWAHPDALSSFPAGEIAWMGLSPLALVASCLGTARTFRRLSLSTRVLRYETRVAGAAALAMAGFLAGAGSWVISGGPEPRGLFRVGAIDDAGLVAMAGALVLALGALQRTLVASGACRAADRGPGDRPTDLTGPADRPATLTGPGDYPER